MIQTLPSIATSLLYAALGFHFWRTHWHANKQPPVNATWEKWALLVPLAIHATLVYQSLFSGNGFNMGVSNAVSTMALLTVLIYWLACFSYKLEGLQALVLPIAAICVLLPAAFPESHPIPYADLPAFRFHLLISMVAYSLFTIAALHATLMTLIERRLHHGSLPFMLANMPPLLTMETLLFRIISFGFVLLTFSLGSGMLFSEELFGKPMPFNHKTIFAIISWGIFAALLGGRKIYGWRGRIAVRWTLSGFAMLFLAYFGSKFVLEVILHR